MIIGLAFLFVLVLTYVIVGRSALKRLPGLAPVFDRIEPVERALWKKSETILWARFQQLLGVTTATLEIVGIIDVTPWLAFVPERHRIWVQAAPPIAVSLNGFITELLRRNTTKPLEIVNMPQDAPVAAQAAAAAASVANDNAVAVIKREA